MIPSNLVPVCLGEETKLRLNIQPIGGVPVDSFDFKVRVFVHEGRYYEVRKDQMEMDGDGAFLFIVDTAQIGVGVPLAKIIALVPDSLARDGFRKVPSVIATNIYIYR